MVLDTEHDANKIEKDKGDLQLGEIAAPRGLQEANLIGLQEADIRHGLSRKGYIRSVLVVSRYNKIKHTSEYIVWIHPSWLRGFYPFCTHRGRSMRSYRDPGLFFSHCRDDWNYRGVIAVRTHDDPKVLAFQAAAARRAAQKLVDLVGNEALLD